MTKTYKCPNCKKEVTAIVMKKPRCKECKVAMFEINKQKKEDFEYSYKSSMYMPRENEQAFIINGKRVIGKKSNDSTFLSELKAAFVKGYGGDVE